MIWGKYFSGPAIAGSICAICLAMLGGCSLNTLQLYDKYEGDGLFVDYKSSKFDNYLSRYHVNFGVISLINKTSYSFKFGNLPTARVWLLGLSIVPAASTPKKTPLSNAVIEVVIYDEADHIISSKTDSIKNWLWMGDADTKVGYGPAFVHGGAQTRFSFKRHTSYRVTLRILEGDEVAKDFKINLLLLGSNYPWG